MPKKGVIPAKVAESIGVKKSTMYMWKKQGTTPKYATLQKLADYFGVTADYLLEENAFPLPSDAELEELAQYAPTDEQSKRADFHLHITLAMEKLNLAGLEKAQERIEELTEIPRYRAETKD